jgi:WD40 repeat protein
MAEFQLERADSYKYDSLSTNCVYICTNVRERQPVKINSIYLGNKQIYSIFKTSCLMSVLFSTIWHLFHSFILFCPNNTFFYINLKNIKYKYCPGCLKVNSKFEIFYSDGVRKFQNFALAHPVSCWQLKTVMCGRSIVCLFVCLWTKDNNSISEVWFNPSVPELNPSVQHWLTRIFYWGFCFLNRAFC